MQISMDIFPRCLIFLQTKQLINESIDPENIHALQQGGKWRHNGVWMMIVDERVCWVETKQEVLHISSVVVSENREQRPRHTEVSEKRRTNPAENVVSGVFNQKPPAL